MSLKRWLRKVTKPHKALRGILGEDSWLDEAGAVLGLATGNPALGAAAGRGAGTLAAGGSLGKAAKNAAVGAALGSLPGMLKGGSLPGGMLGQEAAHAGAGGGGIGKFLAGLGRAAGGGVDALTKGPDALNRQMLLASLMNTGGQAYGAYAAGAQADEEERDLKKRRQAFSAPYANLLSGIRSMR